MKVRPGEVAALLAAAGLSGEDWDSAELAEMLTGQRAGIDPVRERLDQADEPALRFDPRWE